MPYYHVRITTAKDSPPAYELDLSEKQVVEHIVYPYEKGDKFYCGPCLVDPYEVTAIEIKETDEPSSQLLPGFKAEFEAAGNEVFAPDEWFILEKAKAVTRQFIRFPPGGRKDFGKEKLASEAKRRATEAAALEMKDLREQVEEKERKLEEARNAELNLRKQRRELEKKEKAFELEMARKLDEERARIKDEVLKSAAAEEHRLKDLEKEKQINDMRKQIEDLKRKAISNKVFSNKVFIVHGHDTAPLWELKGVLEKLNLQPIILHEQAHEGRTILEKLEDHSDVGYAFIILTPDDEGYEVKGPDKKEFRARQNVIFEYGMFVGKLGRNRVCCLYKKSVEFPSDLKGIGYIQFDKSIREKILDIGKELKAAGYAVDLNKLS